MLASRKSHNVHMHMLPGRHLSEIPEDQGRNSWSTDMATRDLASCLAVGLSASKKMGSAGTVQMGAKGLDDAKRFLSLLFNVV